MWRLSTIAHLSGMFNHVLEAAWLWCIIALCKLLLDFPYDCHLRKPVALSIVNFFGGVRHRNVLYCLVRIALIDGQPIAGWQRLYGENHANSLVESRQRNGAMCDAIQEVHPVSSSRNPWTE